MSRLTKVVIGLAALALTAAGQLTITTKSLAPAIFGQQYSPVILDTSGDPGPMAWDFAPPGSGPSGFAVGSSSFGQPRMMRSRLSSL